MKCEGFWCLFFVCLPLSLAAQSEDTSSGQQALDLTAQIESELRNWRELIRNSQLKILSLTENLENETENLHLLLDDYLRLERDYGELLESSTNQLTALTGQLKKSAGSARFWKRFSLFAVPVTAAVSAFLGAALASR